MKANLIERTQLLAGYVLYTFESPTGYKYRVLSKDGIADPATHSDCVAFKRRGDCSHMQSIIAHETDYATTYDAADAAYEQSKGTEAASNVIDLAAVVAAKVAAKYAAEVKTDIAKKLLDGPHTWSSLQEFANGYDARAVAFDAQHQADMTRLKNLLN